MKKEVNNNGKSKSNTLKKNCIFEKLLGETITKLDYSNRMAHIDGILVKHNKFVEAYSELEEVLFLAEYSNYPEQICILGSTGVGKTFLVEEFVEQYPRSILSEKTIIPVLYVIVPQNATPRTLASTILNEIGDQFFNSGTEVDMTQRILNFVDKCETKLIFLDEFQHLINRDTDHVLKTASDWLKRFIEAAKIPVVLCGLPSSKRIFESNDQLDSRYTNRVELKAFSYFSQEEQNEFRVFLKVVDQALPFPNWSNLADPDVAARIYYFSHGILRYIMRILRIASKLALKKGKDFISNDELRDAYNKITRSHRPFAINPFELNSFDLLKAMDKEEEEHKKLFNKESKN